ncbi:MAG: ABC transporter permease subunit [Phreatobacter sp.]|uniref:ABC transporter permease subunit n=1 Tax=Phreatobacter sp. TaxID=1966341 RepID=UPI001A371BC7|nr:ABC transporter permease subunit [Phreatobacter sp.]MBL8570708.1 ABC transporter permease subunit [Phreatobacter sp.]
MRAIGPERSLWLVARGLWFHRQLRRYVVQGLFLGAVLLALATTISNVHSNLVRQGMAYGWDFLWRNTGWRLSTSILSQDLGDPYWWTIAMGVLNTLVLGLLCIVLATILGCCIGLFRLSSNAAVRAFSTVYVDVLRNVPVIMQIYFWYEIFKHAPTERQALAFGGGFFLSSRGLYFPALRIDPGAGLLLAGLAVLVGATAYMAIKGRSIYPLLASLAASAVVLGWPGGAVQWQLPVLQGFSFRGGHRMPVEFLVLLVAITLYSASYIAEIVRGGLLSVEAGQIEAGRALGLRERTINWRIRFPLAMRSALPPLSNQYLITMKVTSLGAAIGFADLFSVTSSSINHAGQTIEMLVVMMGSYLLINYVLATVMQRLNQRIALKRNEPSPRSGPRQPLTAWLRWNRAKPGSVNP